MKKRILSALWFGIIALFMSSLFMNFLIWFSAIDIFFPISNLLILSNQFEYLLILSFALSGFLLAPKILSDKSSLFTIIGYGALGGLLTLLISFFLTLAVTQGPYDAQTRQGFALYFILFGWRIILLWIALALALKGLYSAFYQLKNKANKT